MKHLNTIIAFFLTLNGWTYHIDRTRSWEERNNLTGVEIGVAKNYSLEGMLFINSFGRNGGTYGINKKWDINVTKGISGKEFFTLKTGFVDGYEGGTYFFVLPFYRYEAERLTFEFTANHVVMVLMIKVNL